mmetsp:Transcript_7645/g.14431  ORF Transcript_7645/g.14431 Transcript_7645/m.14431 type:complete len:221 (-) Transcript_7645:68-730(-)
MVMIIITVLASRNFCFSFSSLWLFCSAQYHLQQRFRGTNFLGISHLYKFQRFIIDPIEISIPSSSSRRCRSSSRYSGSCSSSSSSSSNRDRALSKKPRGYILNGCAWPNPFGELLENFHEQESAIHGLGMDGLPPPKLLFVMARDDPVNPTKGAERVRDCFMKAASVSSASVEIGGGRNNGDGRLLLEVDSIYHDGDHSLPVHDKDALENILNWIMDGYQ